MDGLTAYPFLNYNTMFDNTAVTTLKGLIGWRDHYDPTVIPALPAALTATETGEYYDQYHPALRLDYINAMIPPNFALATFLEQKETEAITQLLNDVVTQKELANFGKDVVNNTVIANPGNRGQTHLNEGRFVGVRFSMNEEIGLRAVINRFAFHATAAQTDLTFYLYHSHQAGTVATFIFNSTQANAQTWQQIDQAISYDNGSIVGGEWFFGYYQNDIAGNAIKYNKLNWRTGYCNTCDGGRKTAQYQKLNKYVSMCAFYVPSASLPAVGTMFDVEDTINTTTENYGLNFNISIKCNLTQYIKDNRFQIKTAIGKKVAVSILEMMKFSGQINHLEENLKALIIRDLEGDDVTQAQPLIHQLNDSIKALNMDMGNLASVCLPCARKPRTFYGSI